MGAPAAGRRHGALRMALERQIKAASSDEPSRMRDAALRRLCDLALLPASLTSPQERSILDTVLAGLTLRLDEAARQRLADRLAAQVEGPRELALALALDKPAIACPVLTESTLLKEGDLVHVAREGTREHRALLASRRNLASAVADVLVELGETPILVTLLENGTAELSHRAIETLARRSAAEPEFQAPLLARPELTLRLAHLIFWWVPSSLRLEILNRFTVERKSIHEAMEDVLADTLEDGPLDLALSVLRRPKPIEKSRLAWLFGSDAAGLVDGLAAAAGIRCETMFRILSDHGGEPLSIFAKATGMNRKEFGDLIVAAVDMRRGGGLPGKGDLERIGGLFDTISTDRADFALHCWDMVLATELVASGTVVAEA